MSGWVEFARAATSWVLQGPGALLGVCTVLHHQSAWHLGEGRGGRSGGTSPGMLRLVQAFLLARRTMR